jgi:ABC-type transport system substrate-binding protein
MEKWGIPLSFWKDLKCVLVTLSCLMLITAYIASVLVTAEASNPNQGTLTMHLVLDCVDYDGQHAIALSLQTELAKIGITLLLDYRDDAMYEDTIGPYGTHWNITWDDAPGLGWDMQFWEFWGMPASLLWWPAMYSAAGMPPYGWQIMSWNNTKADSLLDLQFGEFNPVKRRQLMLLYQQEWIHDTPGPVLYSPEFVQVVDKRFQTPWGTPGWEDAARWYDPFLYTWVEDPMPETVTVKWATSSQWYVYNPMYMWTTAQEVTQCLTHSMLYVVSKEPGAAVGEGFTVRPYLALGDPVWADDYLTCNISLRDDVYWHNFTDIYTDPENPVEYNNEKFTADDVVMTFDALMYGPETWGSGDYEHVLDCSVYPGGCEKLDDSTVRFHLQSPYVEFKDLLANTWAAFILPEHILGSVPFGDWYSHWTNIIFPPPGTGPYKLVEHNVSEEWWKLEAVPNYTPGLNPFGYTSVIDEIIGYRPTDSGKPRIMMIIDQEFHFSPDGGWDATPAQIEAANATGEFWVFNSPIPCTRFLAFNMNHPILSNRYVRQAIAHAINYTHIVDDILPLYCLNGHLQATPVWRSLEWAYPTPADEALYNIGPYEYDIAVAQQYMDMWNYSLSANAPYGSPEVLLGPVGDADFSGFVDLDDFVVWAENVGTTPDAWPWRAGRDVDPDFDNSDYVELADFYDWRENIGKHYPFYGAR